MAPMLMKKKKQKKKGKVLYYELTQLSRWNLCQQIAKTLYHSSASLEQLEDVLGEVELNVKINYNN